VARETLLEQELTGKIIGAAIDIHMHEAQLLTYLRLTRCRIGLLINFNVPVLKRGIKRMVL
jgi:hypothetical protein